MDRDILGACGYDAGGVKGKIIPCIVCNRLKGIVAGRPFCECARCHCYCRKKGCSLSI